MIKILLADKDELACLGIEYIFEILGMFECQLTNVSNGNDVIDHIKRNRVDVLLMDLDMDGCDGFVVINILKNMRLNVPIVVFSAINDVRTIRQVINLGAKAFVSKNADNEFLGEAILTVLKGEEFISKTAKNRLEMHKMKRKENLNEKIFFKEKELIILKLLMDGLTSKEIANYLYLSPRTVEGHRAKLMRKTKTKSMFELAKYVANNNLKLIG